MLSSITKIRVYLTKTNEVKEMNIDEYIMGVLLGEMPVDYEKEALKAQAVVARTYTLNKILHNQGAHENADMCDDINHCQAFKSKEYAFSCWADTDKWQKWKRIEDAVLETKNEVVTYEGSLINAFFHAHSGGKTEDISNIWGKEEIPYLKSVDGYEADKKEEVYSLSLAECQMLLQKSESGEESKEKEKKDFLKAEEGKEDKVDKAEKREESGENKEWIQVVQYNSSGRVDKIRVGERIMDGTEFRTKLGLRSTFIKDVSICDGNVQIITNGYGHGVGLSQEGANNMAKHGGNYKEIIQHYYTGVSVLKF